MKQRGFVPILILLGVLVVAGLAGGAFYFGRQTVSDLKIITSQTQTPSPTLPLQPPTPTPTPDETAVWKTYEGQYPTLGKYSIKYPSNFAICFKDPQSGGVEMVSNSDCSLPNRHSPLQGQFVLNIFPNALDPSLDQLSLKQLVNTSIEPDCNLSADDANHSTLDGKEAYLFTKPNVCPGYDLALYSRNNRLLYVLEVSLGAGLSSADVQPEIDAILSTFKFSSK